MVKIRVSEYRGIQYISVVEVGRSGNVTGTEYGTIPVIITTTHKSGNISEVVPAAKEKK